MTLQEEPVTPYGSAALRYWELGWRGVLPLPPRAKSYPPKGWTGRGGPEPSYADVYAWAESHSSGNIALRLPRGVLGIDVDDYGDKHGGRTIETLEAQYGPLPATWRSSARPGTISGIRFYRIPEGLRWPGELQGGCVELIQHVHRYAVVAPSINPDTGSQYRWYDPDGHPSLSPPSPDDLPELPDAWISGLTGGEEDAEVVQLEVDFTPAMAWVVGQPRSGESPCPAMEAVLSRFRERQGSAHEAALKAVMAAVRLCEGQHYGALSVLGTIRTEFMADASARRPADEVAREWQRLLSGAAGRVLGDPGGETCDCYGDMSRQIVETALSGSGYAEQTPSQASPWDEFEGEPQSRLGPALMDGGSFLFDQPSHVPSLWGDGDQVLWAKGEALMIAAPPGVGKTTLAGQLVRGLLKGGELLSHTVHRADGPVLYLAMDRPRQISRSLRRHFTADDRPVLEEGLTIWPAPMPGDLVKMPTLLVELAKRAHASVVVIDSLKDAVLGLTDDEKAAAYNLARQHLLAAGIDVLELHHMVKRGADGKPPTTLADIYGSMHLTAGVGSAIVLWGQPGDLVVELRHLKQPLEDCGPMTLVHDHTAGETTVEEGTDLLAIVRASMPGGISARDAAVQEYGKSSPDRNEVRKTRRKLDRMVERAEVWCAKGAGAASDGRPTDLFYLSYQRDVDASGDVDADVDTAHFGHSVDTCSAMSTPEVKPLVRHVDVDVDAVDGVDVDVAGTSKRGGARTDNVYGAGRLRVGSVGQCDVCGGRMQVVEEGQRTHPGCADG